MSLPGSLTAALVRLLDESSSFQRMCDALLELSHLASDSVHSPHSAVITIPVDINLLHVLEYSSELAELIVNYPTEAVYLMRSLLSESCSTLQPSYSQLTLHYSQIIVRMNVFNLPFDCAIPSLLPAEHSSSFHSCPLVSCSGIITSLSLPLKYIECNRHICTNVDCREDFVCVFFPGQIQPAAITACQRCGSSLQEDVSVRRMSDVVVARLVSLQSLEADMLSTTAAASSYTRYQPVLVILRGSLVDRVQLGGRYRLVGCRVVCPAGVVTLETLSVNPVPLDVYIQPLPLAISPTIEKMHHECRTSPWSFVLSLAYWLCADIVPAGTYFRLKLGLLMSLVACGSLRYNRRLPLLAVGNDTCSLSRLLTRVSTLSRRHVQHSCLNQLTASSATAAADLVTCVGSCSVTSAQSAVMVSAGSLLLARGGVCCLPDISSYRSRELEQLQKALETGVINIKRPDSGGGGRQYSAPLLTQVWAVYDLSSIRNSGVPPNQGCMDLSGGVSGGILTTSGAARKSGSSGSRRLTRALLESFGMVFMVDSTATISSDGENDPTCGDMQSDLASDLLVSHLLNSVCHTDVYNSALSVPVIPLSDFKSFVSAAGDRSLEMEPDAEHLVRRYFVGSRRARCSDHPDVPVAAVSTITNVAHAFAQLSLRDHVTVDDVTMSILLYEESLAACFGESPLGVAHHPHVRQKDPDVSLGRQNDENMRHFQCCLIEFVDHWANC